MQAGGGPQQGTGHGRSTAASESMSPSSSSSAALERQHQHHQQQQQWQLLSQQYLRRGETNDACLAYQAANTGQANFAGASGSVELPQKLTRLDDLGQHHVSPSAPDQNNNRSQGAEPQMLNPIQQAYFQYDLQASQQKADSETQSHLQMRPGMFSPLGKDQDLRMANMKTQELISAQSANQSQASSSKKPSEQAASGEKQHEHSQRPVSDSIREPNLSHSSQPGQAMPSMSMIEPQVQQNVMNSLINPTSMAAQMQAMQALALERDIDLSHPANASMIAQLIPYMQSRMVAQQKTGGNSMGAQRSASFANQLGSSRLVGNESSPRDNSSSDASGPSDPSKARQTNSPGTLVLASSAAVVNNSGKTPVQHFPMPSRKSNLNPRQPTLLGSVPEFSLAQNAQLNQSPQQFIAPYNERDGGNPSTSQGGSHPQPRRSNIGFTRQQMHVLKAQILVFKRLKKAEKNLPHEVLMPRELLQSITPPPLDVQMQQVFPPHARDRLAGENADDHMQQSNENGVEVLKPLGGTKNLKEGGSGNDKEGMSISMQRPFNTAMEQRFLIPHEKVKQQNVGSSGNSELESEPGNQKTMRGDVAAESVKSVATLSGVSGSMQANKPAQPSNISHPKDASSSKKYNRPLFDFPAFTRKLDTLGSSMMNGNSNLIMAYDIMDLFADEDGQFRKRRRGEKINKIDKILAINLDRKRIRPDLVLRLQIESKKLQLVERQARLRDEIEQHQIEIMNMQDRLYRKFARLCEHQRRELYRQSQVNQKAVRGKKLKSIFLWRKKLLESHWMIRDARTTRNRGIHKYHERMMRELSKKKDEDRDKRMEALKNNDVERYREMLLEQQNNIPGEAAERYAVLSSFLTKTEEYLHKLGGKITAAKNHQKVEEAANAAAAAARAQGLSEEEVRAAAACAREEVMIRNRFSEMNAPRDSSSVNKYYNLAHAVNERVIRQPSMLRAGTLRDYQLVGLQWMLSLYNNKLNGILADEMGLGKTVQVMALIAYLMEFKGNYGPHLIIVPNAVLVNWKSELHSWLPTVSCIYYVGRKDQRSKLFSQEVLSLKFNVLVTTYEFIMYDRSKLSKIDWKYIIIDEAQRMKDRESVLARDLDRYRCQRRLLLTGTPLQNDLKELWSLLNLLLPEVFDNRKAFHDWFSQPFQKDGPTLNAEDDWLETEKKVIVIHRLHQILEPFMLRRRVEDVEGSLPPKVSIILKCRMSAMQSAIYDWIKATGTLRVDPEEENHKAQRNRNYQPKVYKPLNNRCMELRKVCNHPLLNYPFFSDFSEDFIVRSCGKLWILDRILIKLQRTGHRVLLFSTMTKLLDIMEDYLQWRKLVFRRIDGTTSLEDRESAIVDFNHPETDCFIFLLSIRAAGRGLNLQTADTVIIYDPDPNPKNEEQAVARAHRIGQTREVKVIYMEAVVDKIPSHQKEDEFISGGEVDSDDDLAGKDRYMGSIESLIRNNIQQYKIDMADEVINAGRFDQRTTHEERRLTLETLLHDEERCQETLHDVPSLHEVNRMIARSEEEVELFDQMDEEYEWEEEMSRFDQVPDWIRASTKDVNAAVANLSKKPSNKALFGGDVGLASGEGANETEKKSGKPKKKMPVYAELDDEKEEYSEANSEDGNAGSGREDGEAEEETGEVGEFQDGELSGEPEVDKEQSEEDLPVSDDGYDEYQRAPRSSRNNNNMPEEAVSSGSSSRSRRLTQMVSPSVSSQKFGSLSALDGRSNKRLKKSSDELEEEEMAISGDSQMDHHQQSGSWIQDRDEGEDEQMLQPKIKRKRSTRLRPQNGAENTESPHKSEVGEKVFVRRGEASHLKPFKVDRKGKSKTREDTSRRVLANSSTVKAEKNESSSIKSKRTLLTRRNSNTSDLHQSIKSGKLSYGSAFSSEAATQQCSKMSEVVQRKCKSAIKRIQRRINDEGRHIIPLLTELWKRTENSTGEEDGPLDLRNILVRIDKFEYSGVMEIVSDVQHMLKYGMQHYGFTYEVRSEARKVHELLFEVMEVAFPDVDFQEAINSMSFSNPTAATPGMGSSSRRPAHNKRPKLPKGPDSDNSPFQKPQARVPFQKESRFGSSSQSDDARTPLTHPGDLVICKKKRKDREKTSARPGSASSSPLSPSGLGRKLRSPGSISISGAKESSSGQRQSRAGVSTNQESSGGDGGAAWANPVKKMRSDAARRRPSHL